jgi:hypothetical protein
MTTAAVEMTSAASMAATSPTAAAAAPPHHVNEQVTIDAHMGDRLRAVELHSVRVHGSKVEKRDQTRDPCDI